MQSVALPHISGLPPGPELDTTEWLEVERTQPSSLQALYSSYGPIFTIYREGKPPRVYVADPDIVREVFVQHSTDLEGQGTNLFRPLVGQNSLTFLNGSRHHEGRRVLSRALNLEDLSHRARTIADIASAEISSIPADVEVPLQTFTNDVTRKVIVKLLFGKLPTQCLRDLLDAFDRAVACLHDKQATVLDSSHQGVGDSLEELDREFDRAREELDRIIYRQLALRRDHQDTRESTIVDHLIHVAASLGGVPDKDIVCYLMTILVSGQETTSASLAWALYHLSREPEISSRLRQELASAGADVDPTNYPRLPYLQAICMETLRLSAPVPNGSAQKVINGFSAKGYTFPTGIEIVPCICVSHRREGHFAEPEKFDPQRFIERRYPSNEYMPFSVGTRYCPGSSLALQELAIVLALITNIPKLVITVPDDDPGTVSLGPTVRVPGDVTIRRTTVL